MKKLFFATAVAIFAMLSFTSCEEMIVSTDETIDLAPKATITGVVTAELNLQSARAEFVPAGTLLLVEVAYSDINPGSVGKWMDTIAVVADGKYSVAVPTDANGVNVTITPFAFVADQIQPFGSLAAKVSKTYSAAATIIINFKSGESRPQDITYNILTDAPSYIDKVRITGKFTANLNQETGGYENVPNGTVINFSKSTWKDSAIVTNGSYTMLVPKSLSVIDKVTIKSKFIYSKKVWNSTTNTYVNVNHEYKYDNDRIFNTMDEVFDIVSNNSNAPAGEGSDLTVYPIVSAVTGTAKADLDENFNGLENMPNGTIIKFWTTTAPIWGVNVTVSGGQFTVNAPKNQTVYWSTKFNASKKVAMTNPQTFATEYVNEDYVYDMNGSNIFTDDATIYPISAGTGTSVNPIVTISGTVTAELDNTNNTTLENVPNNTAIKFYYPNSNGSIKTVYTNNGTYTIDIPKGRSVTYSGTFNASQKVNNVSTLKIFTIAGSVTADGTKTVNIIATTN